MLAVAGRRCVVVGGGAVGLRRARSLVQAGAQVALVAIELAEPAAPAGLTYEQRGFLPCDLDGALLVVIATDDPAVNDAVAQAAAERGVLTNRADGASEGDLAFMTSHREGPLTVAVHSGGASARAATLIRDQIAQQLDPDWARLLTLALPLRRQIQARVPDDAKRAALLRRLTDEQAMQALKSGGESALKRLYADIIQDSA